MAFQQRTILKLFKFIILLEDFELLRLLGLIAELLAHSKGRLKITCGHFESFKYIQELDNAAK